MKGRRGLVAMTLVVFLGLALALGVACGGGVSQKDYDAVKQQVATKEQELAKAQQDLQTAKTGAGGGQQQITALQQQIAAKDKELADLKLSQTQAQQKKPLIWTETLPTPAPRPTATPRPPGFVAPTAVPPPAELVNEVVPFTFYVEQLTGHQTSSVVQFPSCVPNSQFRRGAHIVWRFEVFDTSTGKRVTGLDKDATVKLVLPNGEQKVAGYSKRGGIGPWMWAAAWDVPPDYPLGTLDYQIVVTKGGRTGTFDQDNVALVRAATATAAGIDSRVQIVE
ncbi:MAG: hypothetical protein HYU29_02185 [Chloroflexi bacterium]|nr:hypothetical protein [Chloroflexota bacterium]